MRKVQSTGSSGVPAIRLLRGVGCADSEKAPSAGADGISHASVHQARLSECERSDRGVEGLAQLRDHLVGAFHLAHFGR